MLVVADGTHVQRDKGTAVFERFVVVTRRADCLLVLWRIETYGSLPVAGADIADITAAVPCVTPTLPKRRTDRNGARAGISPVGSAEV